MNLSETSENVIAKCRWVAEKLDNDYVGMEHFLLAYNKFGDPFFTDLKVSISDKKDLIKIVRGVRISGVPITGDFTLTKDFEFILYAGNFMRWIFSDKKVEPKHIHLAILLTDVKQKDELYRILKNNTVAISSFKKRMIDIQFNLILRMMGVAKLFRLLV